MARVMPRSLKDPVGLAPSNLRKTSQPVSSESEPLRMSGVPPSCSVTTGVASVTGRRSRYSSMTPRHSRAVIRSSLSFDLLHAQHAADGVHGLQAREVPHG